MLPQGQCQAETASCNNVCEDCKKTREALVAEKQDICQRVLTSKHHQVVR